MLDTPAQRSDFRLSAGSGLTIAALGVVYGDIGTSPLYAVRQSLVDFGDLSESAILGTLSLIVWALALVVTVKYVLVIMRADNHGEGGLLALTALVLRTTSPAHRRYLWIMAAGLVGAALFYGDGVITPAISVLSAVEGLKVATPLFEPYVVPISLVLLAGLFLVQSRGTAAVGRLFGPVMLVWFAVLAVLGIWGMAQQPRIFLALDPLYGIAVLSNEPWRGFAMLGAVFLAVTGAETLYADMGHFGRGALRRAWLRLVFPALVLNYLGQGALLLGNPGAIENPFYRLAPAWGLYPLVGLASVATIIASQAVISGAFSITRQAVQLGYLPRLDVQHTSETEIGQVYVPRINAGLLVAVVAPGARLPIIGQPRRRLWHRGQRHDGDHYRAGLFLHAEPGLAPCPCRAGLCPLRPRRLDLSQRQFVEDRRRRLVPDRRRRTGLRGHGDVVARPPPAGRAARPRRAAAASVRRRAAPGEPGPNSRDGDLYDPRPDACAGCAAPCPETLQGAAPARRDDAGGDRRTCRMCRTSSGSILPNSAKAFTRSGSATVSWISQTSCAPWRNAASAACVSI